ncbi:hypothetical protein P9112_004796 [Eukaryota sp. TZLM1-RC]
MNSPSVLLIAEDVHVLKALLHFYSTKPHQPKLTVVSSATEDFPFAQSRIVTSVINSSDTFRVNEAATSANVIIADIRDDRSFFLPLLNHLCTPQCSTESKTIICISSSLTWARTPLEDEDSPFTEEHSSSRRPHIAYRELFNLERTVHKLCKGLHQVSIVNVGILYGLGESFLLPYFNAAWNNESLALESEGDNRLALTYVTDLIGVLDKLMFSSPLPEGHEYILCVDNSHVTQSEMIGLISERLGTGDVISADSNPNPSIKSRQSDLIVTDQYVESNWMTENFDEEELSKGFIDEWSNIEEDFRKFQDHRSFIILIDGPPGSSSTEIAKNVSNLFNIPLFNQESLLEIQSNNQSNVQSNDDVDDDVNDEPVSDLKKLASVIHSDLEAKKCGFVVEGIINSINDYKELMTVDGDGDEDEEGDDQSKKIDYVLNLTGSKDYLRASYGASMTGDDQFDDLYAKYFENRSSEDHEVDDCLHTFLNSEIGADFIEIDVETMGNDLIAQYFAKNVGFNFPESSSSQSGDIHDIEEVEQKDEIEETEKQADAVISEQVSQLDLNAKELLEAKSKPLKDYLLANVMPEVTECLTKVVEVRPDDPIEMLAKLLLEKIENY